jgi:hypothetical protein
MISQRWRCNRTKAWRYTHKATKCVGPKSDWRKAPDALQRDLMDSDLAPTGDSEKSSLPMSPILTAMRESMLKDLTIKGW